LLFGLVKTKSGFSVATDPFIRISEDNSEVSIIAHSIKASLNTSDADRVADPTNWKEFGKEFLQKTGLKSSKELNKSTTFCCGISKEKDFIFFEPMKHAEKPEEGFINISKEELRIRVLVEATDEKIVEALEMAFSICE